MSQQIRISQFVVTYGPGAILEGRGGPRVILRPDIGLFIPNHLDPKDFEISDVRMTRGLLGGRARIFRLPSNAELRLPENRYLYRTRPFPEWRLCLNSEGHDGPFSILHRGGRCPVCGSAGGPREPIRFISACSDGHMDDVDWHRIVHQGAICQQANFFRWYGGGGTLAQIELECPRCGRRRNFGRAYVEPLPCSGRFPEKEPPASHPLRTGCARDARIIQRQASNLRIPDLKTLFTIPPRHTVLHSLLQLTPIHAVLAAVSPTSMQQLEGYLRNLQSQGLITPGIADDILSHPWEEIQLAIQEVLTPVASSYHDLILEEFHALIEGSVNGIPPLTGRPPSSRVLIEIDPHLVRSFPGPNGRVRFRVVPVLHLRTVTVQTGYRRETEIDTRPAKDVDIGFHDQNNPDQKWYPGIEFLGEGIFIALDGMNGWHCHLKGDAADKWNYARKHPSGYPDYVFRGPLYEELSPVFVWWHTLAHSLIRALSIRAGYSAASIRERIYIEFKDARTRGGILVYATQPGSDGTLGGLVALVPHFGDILDTAFDTIQSCSMDPLCAENKFGKERYCGAACYGCVLVPETSCEHRNMWLDRNVVRDNMP